MKFELTGDVHLHLHFADEKSIFRIGLESKARLGHVQPTIHEQAVREL